VDPTTSDIGAGTGTRPTEDAEAGARRAALPGGGELVVRRVAADDVDGLAALYAGLSEEDRYRRFFSYFAPERPFFERIAAVASRGGYGLVAVEVSRGAGGGDGDGRVVGEANYELLPNGDGELAMAVADDHRGWLGPYLLDALVEAAAARGVRNLEADVLVTNSRMLALLRSRGYATLPSDDWVTVRLIVGTGGRTPVWPERSKSGGPAGPRVLVEARGGRWHAGSEAAAAGLEVITCSGPRGPRSRCPVLAGRPCPLAGGADAVVVSHPPDEDEWNALVEGHTLLYPGVPVCVEPRAPRPDAVAEPPAVPGEADVIDDDDPRYVVSVVGRHAAAHLGGDA
jgi:ribosomal protein S18 acetylase RimI-like enzyme